MNIGFDPFFGLNVAAREGNRRSDSEKMKNSGGKISVRRNINASSYMIQLANAESPTRVAAVMRKARADIRFAGGSNNAGEVMKAVRILKHVIKKGSVKISRLKKEEQLENQRKISESLDKQDAQRELAVKLRKMRNSRKMQERAETCDPREAVLEKEIKMEAYEISISEAAMELAYAQQPDQLRPAPEAASAAEAGSVVNVAL